MHIYIHIYMCSYLYYMFNICLIYYIYTYISLYATREMESSLQLTSRNKKILASLRLLSSCTRLWMVDATTHGRGMFLQGLWEAKAKGQPEKNVRIEPKNHCNAFESTQRIGWTEVDAYCSIWLKVWGSWCLRLVWSAAVAEPDWAGKAIRGASSARAHRRWANWPKHVLPFQLTGPSRRSSSTKRSDRFRVWSTLTSRLILRSLPCLTAWGTRTRSWTRWPVA